MRTTKNGKREKRLAPREVCHLRTPQIARRNSNMTTNA
jgi:hypothetical protein